MFSSDCESPYKSKSSLALLGLETKLSEMDLYYSQEQHDGLKSNGCAKGKMK